MNLYEQQPNFENNKAKTKKLMIILGITIIILFILSIGLIFYISYIEKNKFKCYINNARVSIKSDTMIIDENKNNIYPVFKKRQFSSNIDRRRFCPFEIRIRKLL